MGKIFTYIVVTVIYSAAPILQIALMIGAKLFGTGAPTTAGDWLLGAVLPFYGWYYVLFA